MPKNNQLKYIIDILTQVLISLSLIFAAAAYLAVATDFFSHTWLDSLDKSDQLSALGTLGDFVGGLLNPLFALLAFLWLRKSVVMQQEELSAAKEVFDRQLFEQTFFGLLSSLESCRDRLIIGSQPIRDMFISLEHKADLPSVHDCVRLRVSYFDEYVRKLIYLLTYISDSHDGRHIGFLKSTIGSREVDLLAIVATLNKENAYNSDDILFYPELRELIEKYALLDSISINIILQYQKCAYSCFSASALGGIELNKIPVRPY